jgi:hypothetical protein
VEFAYSVLSSSVSLRLRKFHGSLGDAPVGELRSGSAAGHPRVAAAVKVIGFRVSLPGFLRGTVEPTPACRS